jgi:hypothetical protein
VAIGANFDSSVPAVGVASPSVILDFYGPQDVGGLDGRAVTRVWPMPGAVNAEPNYFPLIEFNQPDLPWRYTPQAGTGNKLQPWLCLVVLKTKDVNFSPPTAGRTLGVLTAPVALLPNLSQSFAWAQQYSGGRECLWRQSFRDLASRPNQFLRAFCLRIRWSRTLRMRRFWCRARYALAGLAKPAADADSVADGGATVNLPSIISGAYAGPQLDFTACLRSAPSAARLTVGFGKSTSASLALLERGRAPLGVEGALQSLKMVAPVWPSADQIPSSQG